MTQHKTYKPKTKLPISDSMDATANLSEIIAMEWCDKTTFDNITHITGWSEADIILIMRQNLKPASFRHWRKRVSGRQSKHAKKQGRANANPMV